MHTRKGLYIFDTHEKMNEAGASTKSQCLLKKHHVQVTRVSTIVQITPACRDRTRSAWAKRPKFATDGQKRQELCARVRLKIPNCSECKTSVHAYCGATLLLTSLLLGLMYYSNLSAQTLNLRLNEKPSRPFGRKITTRLSRFPSDRDEFDRCRRRGWNGDERGEGSRRNLLSGGPASCASFPAQPLDLLPGHQG